MLCEAQRCGRYPVLLDVGVGAVIKSPATAPLGSFQLCPRTGYKSIGGGRDGGYERRGYSTRGATANGGGRGAGSTVPSRVQANSIPRSISVSRGDETATVVLRLAASRALDRPGTRRLPVNQEKCRHPHAGTFWACGARVRCQARNGGRDSPNSDAMGFKRAQQELQSKYDLSEVIGKCRDTASHRPLVEVGGLELQLKEVTLGCTPGGLQVWEARRLCTGASNERQGRSSPARSSTSGGSGGGADGLSGKLPSEHMAMD